MYIEFLSPTATFQRWEHPDSPTVGLAGGIRLPDTQQPTVAAKHLLYSDVFFHIFFSFWQKTKPAFVPCIDSLVDTSQWLSTSGDLKQVI